MKYLNMSVEELSDLERAAYAAGDTDRVELLADYIDLVGERDSMRDELDDLPSTQKRDYDAAELESLRTFFTDCFECLDGHYPCPEVSSEYDKSLIFDAIRKGEEVTTEEDPS